MINEEKSCTQCGNTLDNCNCIPIEDAVNEIRSKLLDKNKLVMNRVPKNTLDRFHEMATMDNFCEDYGMVLMVLINEHYELIALKEFLFNNIKVVIKDDK